MKKILCFVGLCCTLTANSQTYLISFAGSGESAIVGSVKVENLMSGTTLMLNGSDILRLNTVTSVNPIEYNNSSVIKIYPNPSLDYATLEISPPVAGDAIVTVSEMTGKPIAQVKNYLGNYRQEFRLTGLSSGFYLISVVGESYRYSGKLVCTNKTEGIVRIEKISFNQTVDYKISKNENKGLQDAVDMMYVAGDRLKFTGISGNFSTVKTDIPESDKTITFNFISCTDINNNNYPVVEIGTQVWMEENLKTDKYNNGELIGTTDPVTKDITGESAPAYQWAYDGDEGNVSAYGRLYTWFAVTDSRKICPAGWHVPSDEEWTTLENYLITGGFNYDGTTTGNKIAKSLASSSGWYLQTIFEGSVGNPDYPAKRNATGFTALPSGFRYDFGKFYLLSSRFFSWSATSSDSNAWNRNLIEHHIYLFRDNGSNKKYAFSVRCLKNN